MNTPTLADDIVGGIAVAAFVGSMLWLVLSVRPLRRMLIMEHDPIRQRVIRVPKWRLSLAAGAFAGLAAALIFAALAAN